jgi:hypothetical protein
MENMANKLKMRKMANGRLGLMGAPFVIIHKYNNLAGALVRKNGNFSSEFGRESKPPINAPSGKIWK